MGRKIVSNRPICPICKTKKLVPAFGPDDAEILLAGGFPGKAEIARGIPWIGKAGEVLEYELNRVGIQIDHCRITNLWMHEPPKPLTKVQIRKKVPDMYNKELGWHMKQLLKEFEGRKALFLMGSELIDVLGIGFISNLSGMVVSSTWFPESVEFAVASVNPAQALHDMLGETRYAVERLAAELWRIRNEGVPDGISAADAKTTRSLGLDGGRIVYQRDIDEVITIQEHSQEHKIHPI